jgi:large subunit ribosomal protein L4e
MARGHRIEKIPEVPLVVSNGIENIDKTKQALKVLSQLNAVSDVEKSKASRQIRCGKGKMRNRRHVQRKGPLVIYNEDNGIRKAFRNIPGVDTCCVDRLNLLQLAPGGHLGRFCIWSEGAFKKLDAVFGTTRKKSLQKKDYMLPRPKLFTDIQRVINSDEVQKAVRPKRRKPKRAAIRKNPLKNPYVMHRLNPYARVLQRAALKQHGLLGQ